MLFVNLGGLCQGASDLCTTVQDCCPDFVGLAETHLDGASIGMCLPPGYAMDARKDSTHHGGSVLLLYRDCLLDVINCVNFYVVGFCEFVTERFRNIAILCIYRQPSDS